MLDILQMLANRSDGPCDDPDCEICNPQNAEPQVPETEETRQRRYLMERAVEVFYKKDEELQKKFGIADDESPATPNEFQKRLDDSKYVIVGAGGPNGDKPFPYFVSRCRWRDPEMKEDQAGYDKARAELKAKVTSVRDQIVVDLAKGLEALQALEADTA